MSLHKIIINQPNHDILVSDTKTPEYDRPIEIQNSHYFCKEHEARLIALIHQYNVALAIVETANYSKQPTYSPGMYLNKPTL